MDINILLICLFILSNTCFAFLGFKAGTQKQIITIKDGQSVNYVQAAPEYEDEAASWLDPDYERECIAREQAKREREMNG